MGRVTLKTLRALTRETGFTVDSHPTRPDSVSIKNHRGHALKADGGLPEFPLESAKAVLEEIRRLRGLPPI